MEAFLDQWGSLVAVGLWSGAALGALAVVVAVVQPQLRRGALVVAALLFVPIGVLGILSIGILFLAAAVVCLVAAAALPRRPATPPPAA